MHPAGADRRIFVPCDPASSARPGETPLALPVWLPKGSDGGVAAVPELGAVKQSPGVASSALTRESAGSTSLPLSRSTIVVEASCSERSPIDMSLNSKISSCSAKARSEGPSSKVARAVGKEGSEGCGRGLAAELPKG